MKILLDECVTKRLKQHLLNHEVYTVWEMGWSGIKNGKLMELCTENNFEILLTIDKNLQYQQNLDRFAITILILNSTSSKIEELITFIPLFTGKLKSFEKHTAYIINK